MGEGIGPLSAGDIEGVGEAASAWFATLRDRLCEAFERLEDEAPDPDEGKSGPAPAAPAGRFEKRPWSRTDHTGAPGGGGTMAMLRGRVFEKAGIHVSTVHGEFAPEFRGQVPGSDVDPRFRATGVSLIAHPWNPHVPTVHMNTRFVATTRAWFGGGADLTPMLDRRRDRDDPDARRFHAAMEEACAGRAAPFDYPHLRDWCDRYFHLPHRNEPRGVGGIFFDGLWSGDPNADLAFAQRVGEAFLAVYPAIVRANWGSAWGEAERHEQAVRRGRYVEFNLLHDRGTIFGLRTGGNVDAILSSLPPTVRWP